MTSRACRQPRYDKGYVTCHVLNTYNIHHTSRAFFWVDMACGELSRCENRQRDSIQVCCNDSLTMQSVDTVPTTIELQSKSLPNHELHIGTPSRNPYKENVAADFETRMAAFPIVGCSSGRNTTIPTSCAC